MAVYRFRVAFEEYDDIYRDIDLLSTQSFADLHQGIQASIGFDGSKPASFFMSNDNWKKGQEITTDKNSGKARADAVLMSDALLSDYIADPHQKIYYVFDPPSQWTFFIELFRIVAPQNGLAYPVLAKSVGDAPKQYLVVEPPKGAVDEDEITDELFLEDDPADEEVNEQEEVTDENEEEYGDAVDEEEYDNIEERSEENQGQDEF